MSEVLVKYLLFTDVETSADSATITFPSPSHPVFIVLFSHKLVFVLSDGMDEVISKKEGIISNRREENVDLPPRLQLRGLELIPFLGCAEVVVGGGGF